MKNENPSISTFEEQLKTILSQLHRQEWTLDTLFRALKGKGSLFLLILFSLPFCQPIQIPGFSTPFGIAIAFIGLRMTFGKRFWWPKWVLQQRLSSTLLKKIIEKSLWAIQFLKPWIHPRGAFLFTHSNFYKVHGLFICLMGLFLSLPLPIPFSNLLAAWPLLLLGLGLMEEDGLFVCLGYGIGCIGIVGLVMLTIIVGKWITL